MSAGNLALGEVRELEQRVKALETENERRMDEIKRLVDVIRSQSETIQMLVDMFGDTR